MSESVYERCPVCHGEHVQRDGCKSCRGDGFVATGLSTAQVESHAADAKRLQIVKAAHMDLQAPETPDGEWSCLSCRVPIARDADGQDNGHYWEEFRGAGPREAIDAAIKGLGL